MTKIKQLIWTQIIIIYTRYLVGGAFVFASIIKIEGNRFTTESGADNPIDSAWHFFETMYESGLYWQFIGVCQLVAGCLLMTQRYAKLGAVMNLPIILNIFVITLSYEFGYTPVITGMMLLANLALIVWHWDELKVLFNIPPKYDLTIRLEQHAVWTITGIGLFLFTVVYRTMVTKYNLILWFTACLLIGLIGFIYGIFVERKRRKEVLQVV